LGILEGFCFTPFFLFNPFVQVTESTGILELQIWTVPYMNVTEMCRKKAVCIFLSKISGPMSANAPREIVQNLPQSAIFPL